MRTEGVYALTTMHSPGWEHRRSALEMDSMDAVNSKLANKTIATASRTHMLGDSAYYVEHHVSMGFWKEMEGALREIGVKSTILREDQFLKLKLTHVCCDDALRW